MLFLEGIKTRPHHRTEAETEKPPRLAAKRNEVIPGLCRAPVCCPSPQPVAVLGGSRQHGIVRRVTRPPGVPEDCVLLFDEESCEFKAFSINDPSESCPL
ncbi:uncharacterized protein LOC121303124 isoform X5 [Polyodon spathula]|uniref:uncharacterized protein LOC121303124 isoform X5 n=1 Tax=Polyodon spathula TaxID=7913 RepID=UPI001B7F6C5A|nr:uncharacterized protein LOC121303124 isoform X5 [Polyodon spathula]